MKVSQPKSFKGFKISKNLQSAIIKAAIILVPAILAQLATQNGYVGVIAGIAASAVKEAIDFYNQRMVLEK